MFAAMSKNYKKLFEMLLSKSDYGYSVVVLHALLAVASLNYIAQEKLNCSSNLFLQKLNN